MGRIGMDSSSQTQQDIQNQQYCTYLLDSWKPPTRPAFDVMVHNPGMNLGQSWNPAVTDVGSSLTIGSTQTRASGPIDLFSRPFSTVPFMGRGAVDAGTEARLQQGEQMTNRRSVNTLSEANTFALSQVPLLPHVRQSMVVSSVATPFQRGGLDTRDMQRDTQLPK